MLTRLLRSRVTARGLDNTARRKLRHADATPFALIPSRLSSGSAPTPDKAEAPGTHAVEDTPALSPANAKTNAPASDPTELDDAHNDALKAVAVFARNLHLPRLPGETPIEAAKRSVFTDDDARDALSDPSTLALDIPPLPPLPAAPKYPCPYLTQEEIETYLIPLYHRGWFVASTWWQEDGKRQVFDPAQQSPQLVKIFRFTQSAAVGTFDEDLKAMQEREKHHAGIKLYEDKVQVRIHTHTALPPASPDDTRPPKERAKPGISLRDVRLALLIEGHFDAYLNADPRTALPVSQRPAHRVRIEPHTPEEVERRRFVKEKQETARCAYCRIEGHTIRDCRARPSRPVDPCMQCGEMHWSWECPMNQLLGTGRVHKARRREGVPRSDKTRPKRTLPDIEE